MPQKQLKPPSPKRAGAHAYKEIRGGGVRYRLARTFLDQSTPLLERLADRAPTDALKRALAQPTALGSLAHLLSDLAPLGVDIRALDPLAEAMARGAAIKRELIQKAGGAWRANRVAEALGITRQAVDKRRRRGKLLAVPSGTGDYLYPRLQFTPEGVLPGLDRSLSAFRVANPWTQLSALLARSTRLRGKTILQVLQNGNIDAAVSAARTVGDSHDDDAPSE